MAVRSLGRGRAGVVPCNSAPAARRSAAALAGLLALPLVLGCAADEPGEAAAPSSKRPTSPPSASAPSTAPGDLATIAALTDCEPQMRGQSQELTEAVCETGMGAYVVTTFPKERFKRVWLDAAPVYGARFLVGPRWVIGAEPKILRALRGKVGGEIQVVGGAGNGSPPDAG